MKATVLDGKQWILDILLNAGIDKQINGRIYKDQRPVNSTTEDVVINSLVMNNHFLQNGVFNVNCHIPKISVTQNGITQKRKNNRRLKEIADKLYNALDEFWCDDFYLRIINHQDLEEGEDNYLNFRVEINTH